MNKDKNPTFICKKESLGESYEDLKLYHISSKQTTKLRYKFICSTTTNRIEFYIEPMRLLSFIMVEKFADVLQTAFVNTYLPFRNEQLSIIIENVTNNPIQIKKLSVEGLEMKPESWQFYLGKTFTVFIDNIAPHLVSMKLYTEFQKALELYVPIQNR